MSERGSAREGSVHLGRDPLDAVAEAFLERYRRGEHPSLAEFAAAHPALAEDIHELFPALIEIERLKLALNKADGVRQSPWGDSKAIPARLGEFRIIREIGRGGMGVVYEAAQESLGRHVALKVLPPALLLDPSYLTRFQREARSAAALHHSNIVPVFGVGQDAGCHYFAMQLIRGQTLEAVLRNVLQLKRRDGLANPPTDTEASPESAHIAASLVEGHFSHREPRVDRLDPTLAGAITEDAPSDQTDPEARPRPSATDSDEAARQPTDSIVGQSESRYYRAAARIALQVAEALGYAHDHGVLHRDIKPSNILIDLHGTAWVADFGLAKVVEDEGHSAPSQVVGTLRYMAPERFRGKSSAQSDVYGLGATLFEMLALRPPFNSHEHASLIRQILNDAPRPPREFDRQIPRDLETIALKAMAKDPADRYQSAQAMAEDLDRYLADRTILARRTTHPERFIRWCRRNPLVGGLAASVGLLVIAIAVGSSFAAVRLGREARRAQFAEMNALERLLRTSVAQAKASRGSGKIGQRHDTLRALSDAAALQGRLAISPAEILDMRSEAIAAMTLPDVHLGRDWEGNPIGTNGYAFDSNYNRYAHSNRNGELTVRRVPEGQLLHRFVIPSSGGSNRQNRVRFSPNDRYLAVYCEEDDDRRALVWDLNAPTNRPLIATTGASSAWSFADSKGLAFIGTHDRRVRQFDLTTGVELEAINLDMEPSAVEVQPQAELIAVAAIDPPVIVVFDLKTHRRLNTLDQSPADAVHESHMRFGIEALAWHPNGELIAAACLDHKIHIWDWLAGDETTTLSGHSWEVADLAFSRSGRLLASYGHDKTVRLWDRQSATLLLTIPGARWIGFSRDDQVFTAQTSGTRLALCYLDMPEEFRFFEAHHPRQGQRRDICEIRFDSRGRMIATACFGHSAPSTPQGFGDGVRVWDLATGDELARLSVAASSGVLFEPDDSAILTYDSHQLRRWPLKETVQNGRDRIRAGPPELLLRTSSLEPKARLAWCGAGGHRIALSELGVAMHVVDLGPIPRIVQSWTTPAAHNIHASPDGRWVAIGSFDGPGFFVWDTQKNRQAFFQPTADASVEFSPDGQWLATGSGGHAYSGAECTLWKVGTWERGPSIPLDRSSSPSNVVFSSDGRMLAVARTLSEISLLDTRDLHELARLRPREPAILTAWRFSPDDRALAVGTADGWVDVWDLTRIRAQLKTMNLDWELPNDPPAPVDSADTRPVVMDAILDTESLVERAEYQFKIHDYRRALADLNEAATRDPIASTINATGAARHHSPGAVLYRLGRYQEAIRFLERGAASAVPSECVTDLFCLAMSYHRAGEPTRAKATFERALRAQAECPIDESNMRELASTRSEAEALLFGRR